MRLPFMITEASSMLVLFAGSVRVHSPLMVGKVVVGEMSSFIGRSLLAGMRRRLLYII
jgi:hypothetical protein